MTDGVDRPARLSPKEQRALLAKLLRKKAARSFPLSFPQERLWFLSQLTPESAVYNVPCAVRLSGPLDTEVLERSLNEILRRHDVLRTTFAHEEEGPVQVVWPALNPGIEVRNLTEVASEKREAEALRLANLEAQRPFDLSRGPLLRATVLRLAEDAHLFVLNMHHIVSEVWSIALLFREMETLYAAFSCGKPSPLPSLPLQYADFAHWQRQWLKGHAAESELAYWKRQLDGDLPVLQLPTDRPRPAVQTFRGAWCSTAFSRTLMADLQTLSRKEGTTLFMTLLAAFVALLHRYTGQEEVVVGSPVAGRNRSETEQLIGMFINTLVLRTDLSGDPTFRELLGRVREVSVGAFAHQELPFEKVVEALRPDRRISHTPVFQVMFALQNTPAPALHLRGLHPGQMLRPEAVHNGTTKVDLTLIMEETPEGLIAGLEYSTDLFEAPTMRRLLGHLGTLLQAIVTSPEQSVSTLPLLSVAERRLVVTQWNDTNTDYPRDRSIHTLFAEQAARTPDAVAASFCDEHISYRELDKRSNQLAHQLLQLGVTEETLVGISVERSIEMLVGLLGILKAGGAYLPLDPTHPRARLALMVEDARPPLLLTLRHLAERLPAFDGPVLCLDSDWPQIGEQPGDAPVVDVPATSLAYVIYTSGSTGRPKGSCVEHRSVVRLVKNTNYVDLGPEQVFLQFAPISFDASTFELWGSLLNGAKLVIFPPQTPSLEELGRTIEAEGITTLWLTAALFSAMVDSQLDRLRGVTQLLAGGETLSPPHVRRFISTLGERRLINGYGPTENTTFTCCHVMTSDSHVGGSVPIGRPIANTRVYLLDARLNPVPVGVPGRLYAGGDGVARGYLGDPELTARKFIDDPFGAESGARMYDTGDQARWLPDGSIEFRGRSDGQVKIRGFRVEPGEIEATLRQHRSVRETVVLAREDFPGDKRLVAYVLASQNPPPSTDELRGFLEDTLPDYMVPSAFVLRDALPMTSGGKVDRLSLPTPEGLRPDLEAAYAAPQSEVERRVAAVWQELLHVDKVGVQDNFFDLGGHSLLLVQAHGKFQAAFDRPISMVDMFRYPTVGTLAEYLGHGGPSQAARQADGRVERRSEGKSRLDQRKRRRQRDMGRR